MITLFVFLTLTIVEAVIIFLKWNEIEDAHTIGKLGAKTLGIDKEYNTLIDKFVRFIVSLKSLIWIPILLLLFCNYIIASILSFVYSVIHFLITLI